MTKQIIRLHFYHTEDREIEVTLVNRDDWDVWLSSQQISHLFGNDLESTDEHIQQVLEEDGLDESVIASLQVIGTDGKRTEVKHYNLDVIIPVGYRVHSPEASRFRKWATQILRDYWTQGVVVNDRRLENLSDEVLERVSGNTIKQIINTYRKRGYGDDKIRSRLNGIISRHDLTDALKERVSDEVNYPEFTNRTYIGLFRRNNKQLEAGNGGDKPRDGMSTQGLDILSAAESSAARLIKGRKYMRYFEALVIMDQVCRQLRPAIDGLQKLLGIDLGTNQPLLPDEDNVA